MVRTLATIVAAALFACAHGFAPAGPVGAFSAFSGGAVVQTESIAVRKQQGASSDGAATMIRHGKRKAELNLPADQRKALLRALTTETIRHGRITTTLIRAKAAQPHIEKMIGLGKRGDLHARRQAMAWVYDKALVHALFEAAPDRYGERNGGYTRILRTMNRQGDNAKMGIIELV